MSPPRALLLFDIDGTLVQRSADAHRDAVLEALRRTWNLAAPERPRIDAAGRTDVEIAREILVACNVPPAKLTPPLAAPSWALAETERTPPLSVVPPV